ncbi:MAG: hypothetical protein AAGD32_02295 [Planctomycetota bacterium]
MSATSSLAKRCISCGKSVEGAKRMKDRKGNYWCYDCGIEDERKKRAAKGAAPHPEDNKGHLSQCPKCREFFPPVDMVKSTKGKGYICIRCHHEPDKKKGKKGGGGGGFLADMEPEKRKKVILAMIFAPVLIALAIWLNWPS